MRIFTKKAFEFKNTEGGTFVTTPLSIEDAPDWIVADPLFGWAKEDGNLQVIESKQDEKKVENDATNAPPADINAAGAEPENAAKGKGK